MRYSDLVRRWLKKEGWFSYYGLHVEDTGVANARGERRVTCPFHDGSDASASINEETGLWNCFVCATGGDVFGFHARLLDEDLKSFDVERTARLVAIELGIVEEITHGSVEQMHAELMNSPSLLARYMAQTRLNEDTFRRFKLGYAKHRLAIPVLGETGYYEDIRLYDHERDPKIVSWRANHGGSRVFPRSVVNQYGRVLFLEGEKDTMRAHQCKIREACTTTSGASSLPDDYGKIFRDKVVYLLCDLDKAGKDGVRSRAEGLAVVARDVRIMTLPSAGLPPGGDFSDYADLIGDENVVDALAELAQKAERVVVRRVAMTAPLLTKRDEPTREVDFAELVGTGLYRQRVRFLAHTVGASAGLKNYQIPRRIDVVCGRDAGKMCNSCSVYASPVEEVPYRVEVDPTSEESLQLIRYSKQFKDSYVRRVIGVPVKCPSCTVAEGERAAVQTLYLSSPVKMDTMREGSGGFRTAYYHGPQIADNRDYYFVGYVHADPKTQESVVTIDSAEPYQNVLEDYRVDDEVRQAIDSMRPSGGTSIAEHFERLYFEVERMTGVYGRELVARCVLDTIYSVLSFSVGNKTVDAGWVETLIVGDTRTAKSTIARRLMQIIDVGEFIGCENVTTAGLIGGIQIVDNNPVPVWGKWPLNDRGMMCLDEILELDGGKSETMGKLSSMRSSGIAEIVKIQQATTPARVRVAMISNPRRGAPVSTFDCGIRSINTVIRNLEDVARFTKATVVSQESVDAEDILKDVKVDPSGPLGKTLHHLAMLTWSLHPDQVSFSADANAYLRSAVARLSLKYHPSLPLWEKGSGLEKLARLSVPVAVLCGSFEVGYDRYAVLRVEADHCREAVAALERSYDDPFCGYDRYSTQEFERERLADEDEVVSCLVQQFPDPQEVAKLRLLIQYFLTNEDLSRNSLAELLGFRPSAEQIWSTLLMNHAIVPARWGREYCSKTVAFVRLLSEMLADLDKARERGRLYRTEKLSRDPEHASTEHR